MMYFVDVLRAYNFDDWIIGVNDIINADTRSTTMR